MQTSIAALPERHKRHAPQYTGLDLELIVHYPQFAPRLIKEGTVIVWDGNLHTLSLLAHGDDYPRLLGEAQFTNAECSLLSPLLDSYPYHAPTEVMLAWFRRGYEPMQRHIDRAREEIEAAYHLDMQAKATRTQRRLYEKRVETEYDALMRPMRNVLSRARIKMQCLGITCTSVQETGYMLMRYNGRNAWQTHDVAAFLQLPSRT